MRTVLLAQEPRKTAARVSDALPASALLPLVYDELCNLAEARVRRLPRGSRVEAAALVHDAYLRIAGRDEPVWQGRAHFFFAASRAMRDVLVEEARKRSSLKSGGLGRRVDVEELGADLAVDTRHEEILMVDEAIKKLKRQDPTNARVVILRYFSGLTTEETAQILGTSVTTVERKWRYMKACLRRELE